MHSPHTPWVYRAAAALVLLLGAAAALWLGFRYALPVLLPFLIALLLSSAIRPLVGRLVGDKKLPRSLLSGFFVILFVGLTVWGIIKGCERAVTELGRFIEGLSREDSEMGRFFSELSGWMNSLSTHLPFPEHLESHPDFDAFCAYLDRMVREGAQAALDTLGQRVPSAVMALLGQLPSVLIFVTSLLLSCYYFTAHPDKPGERLERVLPEAWRSSFYLWRTKLKKALTRYLRAYVILGLITFGEMFLGLSVLKVPYAFLLAWVIALVDFLPLLGAGTVLLPWAAVSLLMGNGGLATGLTVIFGAHTLLRQILEPKLISRELGLSPLTSLAAVYTGWTLFGVGGMLVAPLVAMAVKELLADNQ
ncbi:MAG: sporulation integral membrane protein YtvI [Ruminococcaceae bacterium]|nr:sporulation integral membrane protein YtvI [Oscillospiraceae bacterium]